MFDGILKEEERVSLTLRSLYQKYGYQPYKMSKFEEYDLYVANKEFLAGDGAITFHDADGRLLALKPDVTLSIIKNGKDGETRKLYYDENVYRIAANTKQFKEIRQVGLECVGEVGAYDVYETVLLAAKSLAAISPDFILNVSHLGVLSALLSEMGGEGFIRETTALLGEKNAHETLGLCEKYGIGEEDGQKLATLLSAYGDMQTTLAKLKPLCAGKASVAFANLENLCSLLQKTEYADKIRLDFSVCGDMHYYDDILFKGYIRGVGEGVLSGGRYDKLLSRMGRKSGAIGFAVYLDLLEGFNQSKTATDADVLLLYDDCTEIEKIIERTSALQAAGKSVCAQKSTGGVRYQELLDLRGGKI